MYRHFILYISIMMCGHIVATSIHEAIKTERLENIKTIVNKDQHASMQLNEDGLTPLSFTILQAVRGEISEPLARQIALMLFEHGAKVFSDKEQAAYPLIFAARGGHKLEDLAKFLLHHSEDTQAKIHTYIKNQDSQIAPLIEQYLKHPIHQAVEDHDLERVKGIILQDPNAVTYDNAVGATPLYMAVQQSDYNITAYLLQHGADPNTKAHVKTPIPESMKNAPQNHHTWREERSMLRIPIPMLHHAIAQEDMHMCQLLLTHGADPNMPTLIGIDRGIGIPAYGSMLHIPIGPHTNTDLMQLLLKHKAHPDMPTQNLNDIVPGEFPALDKEGIFDISGFTPLHQAALRKQAVVVDMLLAHNANPRMQEATGETPLHMAASMNFSIAFHEPEMIEKADVDDTKSIEKVHAAQREAFQNGIATARYIADTLIKHGASIHTRDIDGRTPLCAAAKTFNAPVTQLLLQQGADPNVQTKENKTTPLHKSIQNKPTELSLPIVDLLLTHKADPNREDTWGTTPLTLAITHLHPEIITHLISYGAQLKHVVPALVETKIHLHPFVDHYMGFEYDQGLEKLIQVIHVLADAGVNFNSYYRGITPLHYAAIASHKAVAILLEHGANPNAQTQKADDPLGLHQEGWTPLHLATETHNQQSVEMLLQHNANPNITNKDGTTPLHIAADEGNKDILQLLLKHNAHPNIANKDGMKPLDVAQQHDHDEITSILKDYRKQS